ncbi:MAG: IS1595 family transposase [Spirochaetaceae bacterium]
MANRPAAQLRGGIDYPRDLTEFNGFFPDEDACHSFLENLRWPDGFTCPACAYTGEAWRTGRGLLLCPHCRYQASVTAGTIFEGTRKPLRLWFDAAWYLTNQKNGASALGLQRVLGLRSYQTAWAWMHKFRRAMVRPGRDHLSGIVEVDETYVGGEEEGARGRYTAKKAIVAVAVELDGSHAGRVRLRRIPNVRAATLTKFVGDFIEPGSTVHTDGWGGYRPLAKLGYTHEVTVISRSGDPAHVSMPYVHRVASLLKRWLMGTLQGAVSNAHLNYYLDEYAFRFNRRASRYRGLLFYRLIEQAVAVDHTPTKALYKGTGRGQRSTAGSASARSGV